MLAYLGLFAELRLDSPGHMCKSFFERHTKRLTEKDPQSLQRFRLISQMLGQQKPAYVHCL